MSCAVAPGMLGMCSVMLHGYHTFHTHSALRHGDRVVIATNRLYKMAATVAKDVRTRLADKTRG